MVRASRGELAEALSCCVTKELREEKTEWITSFLGVRLQLGQRQVYLFRKGGMPFGLANGLALTVAYVLVKLQAILKLHSGGMS